MKRRAPSGNKSIVWNPGEVSEKQKLFLNSKHLFTCYGGAKGGGKTHVVRLKAVGGAIYNPGIRILIMRRTYPELEENHIRPLIATVPQEIASYNGSTHLMTFYNGSTIKFGHWSGAVSEQEYQGLEFDWIFIDEATQFTERDFNYIGGCLRGVSSYPKRMYLTCNPGGVGHRWVKRLFIDRAYKTSINPEENENPDDYFFIPATVEDNKWLLESSPNYLRMLANMPEDLRKAYRYGDWDALGGNYFPEFKENIHTCEPFAIPGSWLRYRSIDYGLDMLACYWFAVDEEGRSYCYREFCKEGMIVQDAAKAILERTIEDVPITFAPPDLWSRQKDTGKTMAELFALNGLPLLKVDNNRVQGHMMIKDMLALRKDGKPSLIFFNTCTRIISDIQDIQADENNPNDCAKEPHDITHSVDGVRYYCVSRISRPEAPKEIDEEEQEEETYDDYMTGGEAGDSYLTY